MSTTSPFAVIGATGNQGQAVIDALLAADAPVRAVVRDPKSAAATALARRGVELVTADQEDRDSLEHALTGSAALFFFTTFDGPDGTDGEARRGTTVANAAAASVPRVVYSSVGGAERATGIPHFESKRQVEQALEQLLPVRFVRPTFWMENLLPQLPSSAESESVLRLPLAGDVPMQMVAVRDVGRAAARLLLEPDVVQDQAIEIAGDELTMDEVAATIGEVYGGSARFETLPISALDSDADLQAMFRWFATPPSYRADSSLTRALVPDGLRLRDWLANQHDAAQRSPK